MSYTHFSIIERSKLEALHQLGLSARAIARELDRHHSTSSRELKKNQSPVVTWRQLQSSGTNVFARIKPQRESGQRRLGKKLSRATS